MPTARHPAASTARAIHRRARMAVREAARKGVARGGTAAACGRRAGDRALHRVRRSISRLARIDCDAGGLPARVLLQDALLSARAATRSGCCSTASGSKQNVLAPVPHRQYVFTVPRLLRPMFGRHRAWLGELSAGSPPDCWSRPTLRPCRRHVPGLILFVQTFGDLANFNPHVHVLATDGAFLPDGRFVPLPAVSQGLLAESFRRAVLGFLAEEGAISGELRCKLLGWRHNGFSTHNQVRVAAENAQGRKKLAGYMLRAPMRWRRCATTPDGHRHLSLEDARGAETQFPADARCRVAGVATSPRA